MERLDDLHAVRLPLPEHDTKQVVVPNSLVVSLVRQLRDALVKTHNPDGHFEEQDIEPTVLVDEEGTRYIQDEGQLLVTAAFDVRTSTCYNCQEASMEETSFLIYVPSIDTGGVADTRYCHDCATELLERLEEYVERHTDALLADEL